MLYRSEPGAGNTRRQTYRPALESRYSLVRNSVVGGKGPALKPFSTRVRALIENTPQHPRMAAATPCDRPVRVAFDTPPGPGRSPPPATAGRHPPALRRPCRPAPGQPTGAPPPGISRKKARPVPPGPHRRTSAAAR
ncbi:hypothetical protein GCM10010400_49070 [Streptomyces aculeolatus]